MRIHKYCIEYMHASRYSMYVGYAKIAEMVEYMYRCTLCTTLATEPPSTFLRICIFFIQKMSVIPHFTVIFVITSPTGSFQPKNWPMCRICTKYCLDFDKLRYCITVLYGTTEWLAHSKPFAGILLSVIVVRLSDCNLLFRHFLMFVFLLTN
jgi:hypothetical protein